MTGKQRAALRALANELEPIFQIGKTGLTENFFKQVDEALEAREIIKISVLRSSEVTPAQASALLCERLDAQGVNVIGSKFTLYRPSREKPPKIVLEK